MTTPWLPLPIPMLPANDERPGEFYAAAFRQKMAWDNARADREALEMMQKAKDMMREGG